jgi:hypothetical protein
MRRPHREGDLELDAEGDLPRLRSWPVLLDDSCDADVVDAGAAFSTASVASVAACSHNTGLVPMMSITL